MNVILRGSFVVLIGFLVGCATSTFSKTGEYSAAAKSEHCEFNIYTTVPKHPYQEIGLIEFGGAWPRNLDKVKEVSRPHICSNGGNGLLLWESNGGAYFKATVVEIQRDQRR